MGRARHGEPLSPVRRQILRLSGHSSADIFILAEWWSLQNREVGKDHHETAAPMNLDTSERKATGISDQLDTKGAVHAERTTPPHLGLVRTGHLRGGRDAD